MKPTERFSNRVESYIKYRPGYPPGLLDLLREACGLAQEAVIADVGAGTGILTEPFLQNGNVVYAIEPNHEMRAAAEQRLRHYPTFRSVAAAAEAIPLPDRTVDFVVAGQAFHWFDQARAREAFARVLRPGGWAVLIWNVRRVTGSPFLEGYERLLVEYGTDYERVKHNNIGRETLARFFAPAPLYLRRLPNHQHLDLAGLKGRLLSTSYTPAPEHPDHEPMMAAAEQLFRAHAVDGTVTLEYDTTIYYGQPGAAG